MFLTWLYLNQQVRWAGSSPLFLPPASATAGGPSDGSGAATPRQHGHHDDNHHEEDGGGDAEDDAEQWILPAALLHCLPAALLMVPAQVFFIFTLNMKKLYTRT